MGIDYVDKPFNRIELAEKCINEIKDAHFFLLYCEEHEILKGCLVEVGIALAARTQVKVVGHCKGLENLLDGLWEIYGSIEEALESC